MASCPPRSGSNMSFLNIEYKPNYAVVTLKREPVNTMNLSMWKQLLDTLDTLEKDPKVRGVIFISGIQRDVFTAGNDILELYAPKTSQERYREFWLTSNTFLARLYVSRLVTIAAIRGACPAGGCCLSLCCDYRIMTDFGSIGLNEVALGISVPKYWGHLMQRVIGSGPADKLLQFAVLVDPDKAKQLGLVDDVVAKHKLKATAETTMQKLLKAPDAGRAETKRLLRGEFSEQWQGFLSSEAAYAWKMLCHPQTVAKLGAVMERLSSSKGKKDGTASQAASKL